MARSSKIPIYNKSGAYRTMDSICKDLAGFDKRDDDESSLRAEIAKLTAALRNSKLTKPVVQVPDPALQSQLQNALSKYSTQQAEVTALKAQLRELTDSRSDIQRKEHECEVALQEIRTEAAVSNRNLRADILASHKRITELDSILKETQAAARAAQEELNGTTRNSNVGKQRLQNALRDVSGYAQAIEKYKADLTSAQQQSVSKNNNLATLAQQIKAQQDAFEAASSAHSQAINELQQQLESARGGREQSLVQLQILKNEVAVATSRADAYAQDLSSERLARTQNRANVEARLAKLQNEATAYKHEANTRMRASIQNRAALNGLQSLLANKEAASQRMEANERAKQKATTDRWQKTLDAVEAQLQKTRTDLQKCKEEDRQHLTSKLQEQAKVMDQLRDLSKARSSRPLNILNRVKMMVQHEERARPHRDASPTSQTPRVL